MRLWRYALITLLCLTPLAPAALAQPASGYEEPTPESAPMPPAPEGLSVQAGAVDLHLNGYLRPIAFFETIDYGNLGPDPRERFTTVGVRTKLMLDGRLRDQARFFTNYLIDFNEVDQGSDSASSDSENGTLKLLQSYVELYGTSSFWRVGAQIQYWGFYNGFWKPTDRLNAKDAAYKSPDLEDLKLPDTGIEFVWNFGNQFLSLMYIPVATVNKLSPNQIRFLGFLGYEADAPDANSTNSKYVARMFGALGVLDYQLSYIDGLNPRADFENSGYEVKTTRDGETLDKDRRVESAIDGHTLYHRYRSPAVDLQFTTGPVKWKGGAVYFDTGDTDKSENPLRQSDWYEWIVGAEAHVLSSEFDLHYGQIVVPHLAEQRTFTPLDYEKKRVYYQNNLLGQPRARTHVVTAKYVHDFGYAWMFEQNVEIDWDEEWQQVKLLFRPDFTYFVNEARTVQARLRPAYYRNQEIEIHEVLALVQFDF